MNPVVSGRRRWLTFAAVSAGTFVAVLDQSALGLALPKVADHFGATLPAVQWVTLAYMLTTGALLLPMGRLSDIVGRRRIYTLGFVIFTVSAVLTGSSTSLIALIGFKAVQGIGAAMGQATAMAIITSAFPSTERGKVIGTYITVVGLGAIVGPRIRWRRRERVRLAVRLLRWGAPRDHRRGVVVRSDR